jgi:hypothetical protein
LIKSIIRGTTTAGETAATTLPKIKPSIKVIENNQTDRKAIANISSVAGKKLSKIAPRPTTFKSFISSDKPALSKMTISAIFLKSADIDSIVGSIKSKTKGPKIMPVII